MIHAILFRQGCAMCGLTSNALVAEFFGYSSAAAASWVTGRRPIPDGVMKELARLYDQVIEITEHSLDAFDEGGITLAGIQDLAMREHGSRLPEPAAHSVMAAWYLTRLMDAEEA